MPGSMADTPSHFFKVILAATIEDKKLSIPQKFVRKFGNELSAVTTLSVPNGYSWQVGITKDEGKIWFHNGWHEFVKYHSICVGYFIVFQYRKNSNFQVHIFDTTTCEIQYPCRNMCIPSQSSPYLSRSNMSRKCTAFLGSSKFKNGCEMEGKKSRMEEVEVKDELDNVSDSKQGKLCTIEMSNSQGSVHHNMHLSEAPCPLVQETDHFVDNTKLRKAKHNMKNVHGAEAVDRNELIALLEDLGIYICDSWKSLSEGERQRTINAANFFKPKNPSVLVVMRDSNILRRSVYIPAAFSQKYLSRDKLLRVQDSNGTKLAITMNWTRSCFLTGWAGFSMENDVKAGDILFFELIKMKDILLKVSVFHA